jgi:4,5-dihydroxyphthalate decarboxylase
VIFTGNIRGSRSIFTPVLSAKALAREKLEESIPDALFFGPEYLAMTRDMIGEDPLPYGIKANEAMLDTIAGYSYEQGLTPREMTIEELFAESTLEL